MCVCVCVHLEAGGAHGDAHVGQQRAEVFPLERPRPALDEHVPPAHGAQHRAADFDGDELGSPLLCVCAVGWLLVCLFVWGGEKKKNTSRKLFTGLWGVVFFSPFRSPAQLLRPAGGM